MKIRHLDHVAIRVSDVKRSVDWYQRVLKLARFSPPEWEGVPVFLMAGDTGIAIFPASEADNRTALQRQGIGIDHFAFNVPLDELEDVKAHYDKEGIKYRFSDHIFYHSIDTHDPDGHTVEVTAATGIKPAQIA
ncbi:MAG: VOC family protein [Bacteroidia bacterium]